MLVYRGISGALAVLLGLIILWDMLSLAQRDGTKIAVGAVLGIAMIAFGVHRIALVLRARSGA